MLSAALLAVAVERVGVVGGVDVAVGIEAGEEEALVVVLGVPVRLLAEAAGKIVKVTVVELGKKLPLYVLSHANPVLSLIVTVLVSATEDLRVKEALPELSVVTELADIVFPLPETLNATWQPGIG